MNLLSLITPIVITSLISGILGLLISIVSKIFFIKNDEKKEEIYKMLPGYNCGACGKPGCMALAEDICINKNNVNKCKPIKNIEKEKILYYL